MSQKVARPGAALKAFRERNGWTLAEVSRRTGLTISTLSKVENGRVSLNFEKLTRLSVGLELDVASLLNPVPQAAAAQPSAGRRCTTRRGDETVYQTEAYNHLHHATDLLNKAFNPTILEPRARSIEGVELNRHPGEEFAYVLEGCMELHTDTYAPLTLNEGDSIYFDSGMAHAFIAVGEGRCRVLLVSSAPEPMRSSAGAQPSMTAANAGEPVEEAAAPPPRRLVRRA